MIGFITRPRFIRYCAKLKQHRWRRRKWQRERRRRRGAQQQRLGGGFNKKVVLGPARQPGAAHAGSSTYFDDEDSQNNNNDDYGDGDSGNDEWAPPAPYLKPQVLTGESDLQQQLHRQHQRQHQQQQDGGGSARTADVGSGSTNLDQKVRLMRRQSRR